jgi:phage terminase small subunit
MAARASALKEQRFIAEYSIDLNGAQAAIRAGYAKGSARITASKLLTKPNIQAAIKAEQNKLAETCGVTRERCLLELKRLAFYDPGKFYDAHGNPIEIPLLDEDSRRAVVGFEFTEDFLNAKDPAGDTKRVACGYTKKFKLADKHKAVELFMKVVGYYVEKRELSGTMTLEKLVTGEGLSNATE